MSVTLAIVGRPNVGKSTLFNRLAGKRLAIVHDEPGVTRDRHMAEGRLGRLSLNLIDTAGVEEDDPGTLAARMTESTLAGVEQADVVIFLIDARAGVTAGDEIVSTILRRSGKPVVLAANKCEGRSGVDGLYDAYRLGFGDPIALSAEHALGLGELEAALKDYDSDPGEDIDDPEAQKALRLAIVGRPNVGKSSLFNRLLGEERSLTGPEAGLTRDAIAVDWESGGRKILLHDTAGLRKKARVAGHELEQMSVGSTLEAIRFADCVVVLIDATQPFEQQDLKISDLISREGRGVVFAINKWDLIEDRNATMKVLREKLDRLLPQLAGAVMVTVSAMSGQGLERLSKAVLETDQVWNMRVPTAGLNRFLEVALSRHPPPAIKGRRVRMRYMTQVKARPPTFAIFGNQLEALPESYLRYLTKGLRETFGLKGVPIRYNLRSTKNPYAKE